MARLYKAYVLPHLEYCSPLFLGVGNVDASKMESTNYYISGLYIKINFRLFKDCVIRHPPKIS